MKILSGGRYLTIELKDIERVEKKISGVKIARKYHYNAYTIDWTTVRGRHNKIDSFSIHNTNTHGLLGASSIFNESVCNSEIEFVEFINRFIKR